MKLIKIQIGSYTIAILMAMLAPSFLADSLLQAGAHAPSASADSFRLTSAFYENEISPSSVDTFNPATPLGLDAQLTAIFNTVENIDPEEHYCLAQAVYFEARGEPIEGQLAVAQVVLNRVEDRRYPENICGVVYQNEKWRHRCQFSFACDGRSDRPFEMGPWNMAQKIATLAYLGYGEDITEQATHYHATYVRPYWAKSMQPTAEFGKHVFYRDTPRRSPNQLTRISFSKESN